MRRFELTGRRLRPHVPGLAALLWLALATTASALPIKGEIQVKPITVRPAGSNPQSDANIGRDFNFADKAYSQIGINVMMMDAMFLARDDPNNSGVWTLDEFRTDLIKQARGDASKIHAYLVEEIEGTTVGFTVSEEDVDGGGGDPMFPGFMVDLNRTADSFGHEIGHVLHDEFRFRAGDTSDGGIHSNMDNDLMRDGFNRNKPNNIMEVAPMGVKNQIPKKIGTLSTDATALIPQIRAMYQQSSFVQNVMADQFTLEFGMDQTSDGNVFNPTWGNSFSTADTFGNMITVDQVARKTQNLREEMSFYFQAKDAFVGGAGTFDVWIGDIDSLDVGVAEFLDIMVLTYDDDLLNPTILDAADFTWSSAVDHLEDDLNFLHVHIDKDALAGKHDFEIMFSLKMIPTPGAAALLALAGLAAGLQRRR